MSVKTRKVCEDRLLSSFTNHQVVPNLYEFLSFAEHKSGKILIAKQLTVAIDIYFFHTIEFNGYHQLFGYQDFSK